MVNFCCTRCQCHQYLAARYAQEAECCRAVFPLLLHYTIEFTFKGNCRISLCKLVALEKKYFISQEGKAKEKLLLHNTTEFTLRGNCRISFCKLKELDFFLWEGKARQLNSPHITLWFYVQGGKISLQIANCPFKFQNFPKMNFRNSTFCPTMEFISRNNFLNTLRGYCTPDHFFDCLCIFLKNYNTFVTSKICFL